MQQTSTSLPPTVLRFQLFQMIVLKDWVPKWSRGELFLKKKKISIHSKRKEKMQCLQCVKIRTYNGYSFMK